MRMLLKVTFPVEAGNTGVQKGTLPKTVMDFVERMHPEACYFTAMDGKRTGLFFVDIRDPSMMPSMSEPFFINLNAAIEVFPVMNLDEMRLGVEKAMKQR